MAAGRTWREDAPAKISVLEKRNYYIEIQQADQKVHKGERDSLFHEAMQSMAGRCPYVGVTVGIS